MTTNYSPEQLMQRAEDGLLSKVELAELLKPDSRWAFLEACAAVERELTAACAAEGDLCLESGCALLGEACLNAVLKSEPAYTRACVRLWLPYFMASTRAA